MVSSSVKKMAAQHAVSAGLGSVRKACEAIKMPRSSFYRQSLASDASKQLHRKILDLSLEHSRYGYRRITALLRREGGSINAKRVQRIRRLHGLQVRKKQRKNKRVSLEQKQRRKAEYPNHVWSWDFVHDQAENGSRLKILTLIDEHTRECHLIHPGYTLRSQDVIDKVAEVITSQGSPEHIRSDNGPEFIAYAMQDWLKSNQIKTAYIKPGSPWENGHVESFHDKFRDECLNREIFGNLKEARVILEDWRKEYNEFRPHSSLSYQTPQNFAKSFVKKDNQQSQNFSPPRGRPSQAPPPLKTYLLDNSAPPMQLTPLTT